MPAKSSSYCLWRSDAPAAVRWVKSRDDGIAKLRAALAAVADPSIEWCLVEMRDADTGRETVVCARHSERV